MKNLIKDLERILKDTKKLHKEWLIETGEICDFDDYYQDGVFTGQIETLEFVIRKIKGE